MYDLEIEGLKKTFRSGFFRHKVQILHGVNFAIKRNSITGFLGKNGTGKTTTIKCALGLNLFDEGVIKYFGKEGLTSEVKSLLGFLPERPYFYDYLTAFEFLNFYGRISGRIHSNDLNKRIDEMLEKVNLSHARDRQLRNFSKGMLQRIGIAQALIHRPKFVILDEPMSGLDPDGRFMVAEVIREVANQGTTVFFSSHLLHDMESLCTELVILNKGKTIFSGPTQKFLGDLRTGMKLLYRDKNELKSEVLADSDALQTRIDQLRDSKIEIVEVKSERPTLEEAFVSAAGDV
jgi:ABC-2 type transport system ATP-binding protein